MSDVTRRLSRWKAKYSPEIAVQTTARIYADMTERYQASMVALRTMETESQRLMSSVSSSNTNDITSLPCRRNTTARYVRMCSAAEFQRRNRQFHSRQGRTDIRVHRQEHSRAGTEVKRRGQSGAEGSVSDYHDCRGVVGQM